MESFALTTGLTSVKSAHTTTARMLRRTFTMLRGYLLFVYDARMTEQIQGHKAVRAALRDTETYSSDLQGDADVRDYRQIPLEVDPPRHHAYRTAINPLFVRPRIESLGPEFSRHAKEILDAFEAKGGGDFINEVALPYVVRCLGVIYNRPQDFDEWMSWGADVWISTPTGRSGELLHSYLYRMFEEAE